MNEEKRIVEEIYDRPAEDIPELASKSISEVTSLIEEYANNIIKKSDVINNRWILLNVLHVLYKDLFLLQTEDLEKILKSNPKKLEKSLEKKCSLCDNKLSHGFISKEISQEEKTKGLCLDCFISEVKEGDWWDESWVRLSPE